MITRKFCIAAAALLLVLSLSACVSPGAIYQSTVCGHQVTYYPDDLKPCARGSSACTLQLGPNSYDVHYSTLDTSLLDHEREHICGMRHREPWINIAGHSCTEVTAGGVTGWNKGDVMCRVDSGPPVRIADARERANIVASAGWGPIDAAVEQRVLVASGEHALGIVAMSAAAPPAQPAAPDVAHGAGGRFGDSDMNRSALAAGQQPTVPPETAQSPRDPVHYNLAPQALPDADWDLAYGEQARRRDDLNPGSDYNVRPFHLLQWRRRAAAPPLLEPRTVWEVKSSTGA